MSVKVKAMLPIVKSDSTSQNLDLNQTSLLGKIRPKSDQNHNLTTFRLSSVPAGIDVPYSNKSLNVPILLKIDFC